MDYTEIIELEYFGNTVGAYLGAAVLFVGAILVLILLQKVIFSRVQKWTEKTPGKFDDLIASLVQRSVLPVLYAAALYFAVSQLELSAGIARVVHGIFVIIVTFQAIRMTLSTAVFFIEYGFRTDPTRVQVTKKLLGVVRVLMWGIGAVFALDNLGFDVNAVIAGLGIGGVAVALAAQTILGDLFNYFVIFFDKPFEEGDFVIVGDSMGVIQHIGIKTTRIMSLSGEQIICSNSDMASSRIRNYKRMQKRRVLFKIGVVYSTPPEVLKEIPVILRQIVERTPETIFDRAHFQSFGDFSLNFETVYYIIGADYNKYADIQQAVLYAVVDAFTKEGIQFAFPTQTLHLEMPPVAVSLKS